MRKADYELLAHILLSELEYARVAEQAAMARHGSESSMYSGQILCVTRIAEIFANRAHVDKAAFLKACGIT